MRSEPAQASAQGLRHVIVSLAALVENRLLYSRVGVGVGGFGMPQVDMQSLDLLDQQQDRLTGCAHVETLVARETAAPRAELIELCLIQSSVDDGQCKTAARTERTSSAG